MTTANEADFLRERLFEIDALITAAVDHIRGGRADLDVPRRLLLIMAERIDHITADLEQPLPSASEPGLPDARLAN
jgi:hypothetical protein